MGQNRFSNFEKKDEVFIAAHYFCIRRCVTSSKARCIAPPRA